MQLELVGLPMSGKTTVFNALTGAEKPTDLAIPGKLEVQLAVVNVPDPRLDALDLIFEPERKVESRITFADIGGLAKGISDGGLSGPFRTELSQMDGFIHVVRVFNDPNIPHPEETLDPQRDLETLDSEFYLADLILIENRIMRLEEEIARGKDRAKNQKELDLFRRLQEHLEQEQPLRDMTYNGTELNSIRGYGFLTLKPKLVILNSDEGIPDPGLVDAGNVTVLNMPGKLEAEISQLDEDEAVVFLEEYGIEELMRNRIIREAYGLLNVQTFFTVGEDEVRAWPCKIGSKAPEAAGVIHSDLERGFIRAEIVPASVLIELGGLNETRQAGKLRLEGKDYVMTEGDVMTVRFNV